MLNKIVLDAALEKVGVGERELALTHFHQLKKDDLVIYDRGYPGYDFIYEHVKAKVDYLIRAKLSYSSVVQAFVESGKTSAVTEIYPGKNVPLTGKEYDRKTAIPVRLVRIRLPGGETEVLITSLLESRKHPVKIFKDLYFLRWGIETFYDELKNKLKVEHFTGYSAQSILQDFYCAVFISNIQSVIVNELQEELEEQNQGKKYGYKINTNLSYGFLKNRILGLLFEGTTTEKVYQELKTLFLKNTVPIRNNRTNPRDTRKYKNRIRPKVAKNQKDAI